METVGQFTQSMSQYSLHEIINNIPLWNHIEMEIGYHWTNPWEQNVVAKNYGMH